MIIHPGFSGTSPKVRLMSQTDFIPNVSCFQSSHIILIVLDMMVTFLDLVSDFPNEEFAAVLHSKQ
jgi:hypothetical protein